MYSLITFKPDSHTYWDATGNEYISVTTLLSKEFPFDRAEIADTVRKIPASKYHGMSQERILTLWENSADLGTVVHEAVEDYIKEDIWPSDPSLVPLVKQFSKLNFRGELLSEILVWDEDYRIAGTADILECFDKYIYLWDIKTSNKISDDKLMKFSMQLEIYKRLIEKRFNKPVKIGGILWFQDFVMRRSNTKLKVFQTLHCADSVDEILKRRKKEIGHDIKGD